MRRIRTITLILLAALATMCSAPLSHTDETEATPTRGDEPSAQGVESAGEDTASPAAPLDEDAETEDTASPAAPLDEDAETEEGVLTAPTVSARISFDLRGMPHRGPRDVNPHLIDSRRGYLMQQVRDAAGEPAPRLVPSVGASTFAAEFFGPEAQALAQCQRVVAEVAPPPGPHASRRMVFSLPTATPCVAIEEEAP